MRWKRWTRALITGPLSLLMMFAVLSAGVTGQEDQQSSEESQKSLDKLQYQYGLLKDRVQYLEEEVEDQKAEKEEEKLLDLEFTPGYERPDGYMQPGRADEFNLRLGQTGPMDVYMALDTVGRLQAIDHDSAFSGGTSLGGVNPDFQKAHGNISFLATFNDDRENKEDYLEVYLNWLISSRHHSEMFGDQGYMLLRRIPDGPAPLKGIMEYIDVKAGEYELPFGDHIYRRSNNADVQRNALIGNSVVDGRATETGVTVMNSSPSSEPGKINWLLNVSSGDPTPSFNSGNSLAVLPKVWANLTEEFRGSISAYRVDQSDNGPGFPVGGDSSNLLTGLRDTGGIYEGILGGGPDSGQVLFQGGQDVTALQGDLTYTADQFELYGNLGYYEDADPNGTLPGQPTEEWLYGTIEGVYHLSDRIYAAARYSGAFADSLVSSGGATSVSSSGRVDRFQIGGGYWLTKTVLMKLEYVHQEYSSFSSNERQVSGVDSWRDPSFNGVIAEVSFSF